MAHENSCAGCTQKLPSYNNTTVWAFEGKLYCTAGCGILQLYWAECVKHQRQALVPIIPEYTAKKFNEEAIAEWYDKAEEVLAADIMEV